MYLNQDYTLLVFIFFFHKFPKYELLKYSKHKFKTAQVFSKLLDRTYVHVFNIISWSFLKRLEFSKYFEFELSMFEIAIDRMHCKTWIKTADQGHSSTYWNIKNKIRCCSIKLCSYSAIFTTKQTKEIKFLGGFVQSLS